MSTPDYPLLTVPGYELYQLAHLTTFAVDALARHRRAAKAREHPDRRAAAAAQTPTDAADARPDTGQRIARRVPGRGGRPAQPRELRRSTAAPPVHAITALRPDLAPLPRRGRRRLPDRRPLLRPGRPNRRHPPDVIAPARRLLGEIPPPDPAAPRRNLNPNMRSPPRHGRCVPAMRWPLRHHHRYRATGHGRGGGGAGAADGRRGGGAARDAGPDRATDAGGDRRAPPVWQLAPLVEPSVLRYLRATRSTTPGDAGVGAGVRARRAGCRTRRRHRLRAPDPRVRRPVRAGRRRVAVRRVPDPLTDNQPCRRRPGRRGATRVVHSPDGGCGRSQRRPGRTRHMPSMPTPTPTPPPPAQPGRDGDPRTAQRAQPSTQLQVGPGVRPDAGPDSGSGAAVAAVSRWQTEVQQTWAERPSSSLLARGCGPACPPESAGGRSPVRAVDLLEYAAQLKDVFRRKASSNVPAPPRGPACRRLPYFPVV